MTHFDYLESPLGTLLIGGDDGALRLIVFEKGKKARAPEPGWSRGRTEPMEAAAEQLTAYFRGELKSFDLPLGPEGTQFQRRVWDALLAIAYGETISYGELARRIGRPSASRAVGAANGANPLPIVVPCHRVIGASGGLTGYGGGLPIKKALLELEEANTSATASQETFA